jgi:hypothetical protein
MRKELQNIIDDMAARLDRLEGDINLDNGYQLDQINKIKNDLDLLQENLEEE